MSRVIVYDGECSLCVRSARMLVGARLVPADGIAAWDTLDGDDAQRAWDADFSNEMAVLDTGTGEIRSGARGLMWVLRDSWLAPLAILSDLPVLRSVTAFVYRTVAYNRRVLAPPPTRGFVCACDPDEHRGYQWSLIVLLTVGIALLAATLGAVVARESSLATALDGALAATLVSMICVLPLALVGLGLEPSVRMKYLGGLAITAFAAALVLIPVIVLLPRLGRTGSGVALAGTIAAAFAWLWRALRRRIDLLGLEDGFVRTWTAALFVALAVALGAFAWVVTRV